MSGFEEYVIPDERCYSSQDPESGRKNDPTEFWIPAHARFTRFCRDDELCHNPRRGNDELPPSYSTVGRV
ncbi:MAG: hypothetical protein JW896_04050 [Deltaproteobacteria bacterium]|nr:hypothetical protein [Deltaproteobacteria bacterium]